MARIRIVTDSACDLSADVAEAHGITVVPLSIRFGGEEFVDGRDLTTASSGPAARPATCCPRRPRPSPGRLPAGLRQAAPDGYDGVLSLSLSGGVSATFQSAAAAAKAVADTIDVRAVDSRSMTMGLGLICLDVADLAATGADLDALEAPGGRPDPPDVGVRRGGHPRAPGEGRPHRRGPGAARVTPVHQAGGHPGRRRGRRGVQAADPGPVAAVPGGQGAPAHRPLSRIAVADGAATDIDEFLACSPSVQSEHPLVVTQLGPVVGTHTGPGTIGSA